MRATRLSRQTRRKFREGETQAPEAETAAAKKAEPEKRPEKSEKRSSGRG